MLELFQDREPSGSVACANNNDAALLKRLARNDPGAAADVNKLTQAATSNMRRTSSDSKAKATRFEAQRDHSEEHHRGFQLAEGAFQIAIVLASVAIVARLIPLALVSGGLGLLGLALLLDGFLIFVKLH